MGLFLIEKVDFIYWMQRRSRSQGAPLFLSYIACIIKCQYFLFGKFYLAHTENSFGPKAAIGKS